MLQSRRLSTSEILALPGAIYLGADYMEASYPAKRVEKRMRSKA